MYYDYKSKIKALELERERLEYEKTELVFKLDKLNEKVEWQEPYYWGNGDIRGGETHQSRRGRPEEISAVKDKIAKINEKIKDLERKIKDERKNGPEREQKSKDDMERKKIEERETKIKKVQEDEQAKKFKFKEIKRLYKAGTKNVFVRMFKRITLSAPRWRKIKKLSLEEMEFITKIYRGNTWKRRYDNSILLGKAYDSSKYYSTEDKKKVHKSNWNAFCEKINSANVKDSVGFDIGREDDYRAKYERYKGRHF